MNPETDSSTLDSANDSLSNVIAADVIAADAIATDAIESSTQGSTEPTEELPTEPTPETLPIAPLELATSESNASELATSESKTSCWQQGQLLELTIEDLNHTGDGVGRWQGRVVFVPDTAPGDRVVVRLVRVKPQYAYGKLQQLVASSPQRIRSRCIVADKCGGCQWHHVDYALQQQVKRNLIIQDLERIGGFTQAGVTEPLVNPMLAIQPNLDRSFAQFHPTDLSYRNKATYPLSRSSTGQVQAGYYQKGSHQLVNLNQCPIQDDRLDPLLAEIKQDIQQRGWSIYNEAQHQGRLRHLGLRIGRRTGEMLLTLVSKEEKLSDLSEQAQIWLDRYPGLVGVILNVNPDRTNVLFGAKSHCVAGRDYLLEEFSGLTFQIQASTFFQVYTEAAEALLMEIIAALNLQGDEILLDAYCGIGTMTLPLAQRVRQAIGVELQAEAVAQAERNASLNGITNASFIEAAVETWLPQQSQQSSLNPDIVLLDPPRKGCDRAVMQALIMLQPRQIVYVSCNSSTLARDLKMLCETGVYQLDRVQPVDFFPQTVHGECAAFLSKRSDHEI